MLRHVHGHPRFTNDVDAVGFVPGDPATDPARSLDVDKVRVASELFTAADVQVEISYSEAVAIVIPRIRPLMP